MWELIMHWCKCKQLCLDMLISFSESYLTMREAIGINLPLHPHCQSLSKLRDISSLDFLFTPFFFYLGIGFMPFFPFGSWPMSFCLIQSESQPVAWFDPIVRIRKSTCHLGMNVDTYQFLCCKGTRWGPLDRINTPVWNFSMLAPAYNQPL